MKKKGVIILISLFTMMVIFAEQVEYWPNVYKYFKDTKVEITNDIAIDYMILTAKSDYNKYKNDEFEWASIVKKYKTLLEEKIATNDISNKTFTIVTGADFGQYNSEKQGYEITLKNGTFFPVGNSYELYQQSKDSFQQIGFVPKGFSEYNIIPMELEKAKKFLESRKNKYGNIDRSVKLLINFSSLLDCGSDEYKKVVGNWRSNYFYVVGVVESIEVYGNDDIKIADLEIK